MEKEKDWYSKKIGLRLKDMKNLNFIIRTLQNKVCQQFCEFDNLQIFSPAYRRTLETEVSVTDDVMMMMTLLIELS